jgi:hypothetical protein
MDLPDISQMELLSRVIGHIDGPLFGAVVIGPDGFKLWCQTQGNQTASGKKI